MHSISIEERRRQPAANLVDLRERPGTLFYHIRLHGASQHPVALPESGSTSLLEKMEALARLASFVAHSAATRSRTSMTGLDMKDLFI